MSEPSKDETAVNPAVRQSSWNLMSIDHIASHKIREFVPNDVTGVCYNHHYRLEPDWQNACWGSQYSKLSELKSVYDPGARLNCWHCVGWQGGDPSMLAPTLAPTPSSSSEATSSCHRQLLVCNLVLLISILSLL